MCNYMGCNVSRVQYIRLKQIEKELGTIAALKELKAAIREYLDKKKQDELPFQ